MKGYKNAADRGSPAKDARFQPHIQRSGMWGLWKERPCEVLKERYKLHDYNATYIHSVTLSGYPWQYLP
ncbi:hypothetical protein Barb6XT_02711 [Bacteroidales bacterium Barb6XT]|nr:hypothetical protein Barb6XT_02711 [Bacteroidales bacterium Barb6XT]